MIKLITERKQSHSGQTPTVCTAQWISYSRSCTVLITMKAFMRVQKLRKLIEFVCSTDMIAMINA